ncbi:hypothetical protein U472_14790 [Orenia metallireducens]|jgi:hypothetical protein|uniref:Uncharacterized protein n=1 Tax=Orenia metallireducens TaxID=1413210 RepID=A0A1C0A629_9FIRM|nr:hypothetical protein [Orenia metallireducens]OCL25594.1 hypothetical protein U472_14790 [Orenia metallireducens]
MKKLFILCLALVILALHTPLAMAETVTIDTKVVEVDESEMIKLASQEKFDNLTTVMKKLVQLNISTEENIVELEKISIIDFEYGEGAKIRIYYQIN